MLKSIFSVAAGLAISFAIVFATDALFHQMSTSTIPADTSNRELMRIYVASQPASALAAALVGWAIAAFAGSAFAAWLARRGQAPGWIVAALFFAATAANFAMVPHPMWMVVTGVVLIVAAGWLGSNVGARLMNRQAAKAA